MFFFRKKYNLEDLSALKDKLSYSRSEICIAVIDDNEFPNLEGLRRHNFNITTFLDIDNINALKSFDIIISDIKGVGKHFGSSLEGAHLIEEIHKKFPNKYLIAYSASTFNPTYNDYFKLCDDRKRKNIDINEWVNTLDNALCNLKDPMYQWQKTRQILINQKIPIEDVSNLERSYIKSVLKKNHKYLSREISRGTNLHESPLVKIATESITSFASSLISNIITK